MSILSEVIELNNHRLLNGDATNKSDVDKLIGDCKVNLLLTDPPYGIDIVNIGGGQIGGQGGTAIRPFRERERESKWQQSVEQNLQPSKVGTVGTPARPGFKRTTKEGGQIAYGKVGKPRHCSTKIIQTSYW